MFKCSNADTSIKNKMRRLYRACFNDSESYIDYFFENKYAHSNIYCIERNQDIASGLYVIDKSLSLFGQTIALPYIVAAATYPEHRRKGLIRQLISAVAAERRPIIALYPFSHEYYEQFGFFAMNYNAKLKIAHTTSREYSYSDACSGDSKIIHSLYQAHTRGFDSFLLRREADIKDKINETYAGGGKCIIIQKDGCPIGYAMYDNEEIIETSLSYKDISAIRALDGYYYNLPVRKNEEHGFGHILHKNVMYLITDIKALLDILSKHVNLRDIAPDECAVAVTDPFVETNNIVFSVDSGGAVSYTLKEPEIYLSSSELGAALFGGISSFVEEKY